jgi:hypothetical protein
MAFVLRFWFLGSSKAEVRRLRRIDVIKGHRLAMANPAVRVFSAGPRTTDPV